MAVIERRDMEVRKIVRLELLPSHLGLGPRVFVCSLPHQLLTLHVVFTSLVSLRSVSLPRFCIRSHSFVAMECRYREIAVYDVGYVLV
jgi:hypothetical protein